MGLAFPFNESGLVILSADTEHPQEVAVFPDISMGFCALGKEGNLMTGRVKGTFNTGVVSVSLCFVQHFGHYTLRQSFYVVSLRGKKYRQDRERVCLLVLQVWSVRKNKMKTCVRVMVFTSHFSWFHHPVTSWCLATPVLA